MRLFDPEQCLFDIRYGDCIAGMGQMDSASIDVVVTSPPYNLGIEYGTYQDNNNLRIIWIGAMDGANRLQEF